MNREELEAELAVLDLVDQLDAAKEKVRGGDTSEEARAELQAAKLAVYNARQEVRKNRPAPAPEDGVAEPAPVAVTTEAG